MLHPNQITIIKATKDINLDYDVNKAVSYSQYQIYNQCPHRWKIQYIDKIRPFTPSIYSIFGDALHETLQMYLETIYNVSGTKANDLDLEKIFNDKLIEKYKIDLENNNFEHFSTSDDLKDILNDGIILLDYFKKNRLKYFSKKGWELLGIEIPLCYPVDKDYNNLFFIAYLDVVLYDKENKKISIIDIKTSTRGWSEKSKKDEIKTSQLIIYKNYFAEQYSVPVDNIDIQYLIFKRKLYDNVEFYQSRIQKYSPSHGKIKQKQLKTNFNKFISECFTKEGKYNLETDFIKLPSPENCKYCPFNSNNEICDKNEKSKTNISPC